MNVLVTTGFGNIIQGGADIWTNHFIDLVLPKLKDSYYILVDGKRPVGFNVDLEDVHFHDESPSTTESLLNRCDKIHFLHSNYHYRDHLWKHRNKWDTIFVHAYLPDMLKYGDSKRQFQTKIETGAVNDLMRYCKQRVWIGLTDSQLFKDYPTNTITIPNFYEFKHNILLKNLQNNKIGFTSRIESRKNVHYLDNHQGCVLSSQYDWRNIVENSNYNFDKIRFYQWDIKILDSFMKKNWTISHSCHTNEPFGYSIFQAVDYGKVPIIHSDWGDVDYKYRASNKKEFDKMVKVISSDSFDEILDNFGNLQHWMRKYNNKERWAKKIQNIF